MRKLKILIAFYAILSLTFIKANAETRDYPSDANVANVKNSFGAKGDGVTDDTQALQNALLAASNGGSSLIFIPNGTYLVSGQLIWNVQEAQAKRIFMYGESRDGTIIKLKDNCSGFQDARHPVSVIRTASNDDLEGPANAFRNAIHNLTVDVGSGNPGANGIFFYAHNQGMIGDVKIISNDPNSGNVGLDCYTGLCGPQLCKNIEVVGFDYGIRINGTIRQVTLYNITLSNQRKFGIYNENNIVSVENLVSNNTVSAVRNQANFGYMTVINANCSGGSSGEYAIENNAGYMFCKYVTTSGYKAPIRNVNDIITGVSGYVEEFVSNEIVSQFPTTAKSLNLPIENTPDLPWDNNFSNWANADNNPQAAIDAGKPVVYFSHGQHQNIGTIHLRGNVQRFEGMQSKLYSGTLIVDDGTSDVVIIENFEGELGFNIEINTTRKVVIRSLMDITITNTVPNAQIYIEDIAGGPYSFTNAKVFGRQVNVEEAAPAIKLSNSGGDMVIIGMKTERGGTIIKSTNGARTFAAGLLVYATSSSTVKPEPMFIIDESSASLSFGESCQNENPFLNVVSEKRGGITKIMERGRVPLRDGGSVCPLYVGYPSTTPPVTEPKEKYELPIKNIYEYQFLDALGSYRSWAYPNFQNGDCAKTDRQYTFSSIPDILQGGEFIYRPASSYIGSVLMSFKVKENSIVYIGNAPTDHPWWLADWAIVPEKLEWVYSYNTNGAGPSYNTYDIYKKNFPAGSLIELPPNNNYPIVVQPDGVLVPATGVTISPTSAAINLSSTQLIARVTPNNATNKKVSWSSNNTSIASVDTTGLVTGVAQGSAVITATTQDGGFTATCPITVDTTIVNVTGVTVGPASATIEVNATQQLTASITPSNATNKNLSWRSSNTSVATVNSSGLVSGVGAGNATITVTTEDQGKTAISNITVNLPIVPVTGVAINPASANVGLGGTQQLNAVITPSNATNQAVSWNSSDSSIVTVNSTGFITGVSTGMATITVTTQDGNYTSSITVVSASGLYAYDGFDYPAGNLSGQNSGAGWSTSWTSTGTVASPGLTYTGCESVGNKGVFAAQTGSRTTSQTLGGNGKTVWMGFILFESANGAAINIQLKNNETCKMSFNKDGYNHWGIDSLGTNYPGNLPWTNEKSSSHFWLFKMVFGSTNADITVWRDPNLASEPTNGGTKITIPTFTFNNFYISQLVNTATTIDEIRLGLHFTDIRSGSTVNVPTNINPISSSIEEVLKVFPNPSNGIINIMIPSKCSSYEVNIYNYLGAEIYNNRLMNSGLNTIDLSGQSSGVYFIKVNAGNSIFYKNFILIK